MKMVEAIYSTKSMIFNSHATFQSKYAGYYESVYALKDYRKEIDAILEIQRQYAQCKINS